MSLDDFPIRDRNSELAEQAEAAFEHSVVEAEQFVIQQRDRRDYGTDFQLAAKHLDGMSNYRVHVQLKGTDKTTNKDGSISVSVARTNLNYILSQPNSIYVCYHFPTLTLYVRSAEDVFRDAEHAGEGWRSQDSLTVRFRAPFDAQFQLGLRAKTVAVSSAQRDDRLNWIVTPPDQFPEKAAANIPSIVVPESPNDAFDALKSLYESRRDDVISKAFDQFAACLGPDDLRLTYAYLSEINLAMRRQPFNRERVSAAIDRLKKSRPDNGADVLYCRGNGHSALRQTDEAKQLYREAIRKAHDDPDLAAQCWKNLGSELELEGDHSGAYHCYERAVELSPDLMEAHLALAMSHQKSGNLERALQHFDHVVWSVKEAAYTLVARGWRAETYFRLGMADKAFEDILVLLPQGDEQPWIPGWCARLVYNYARSNKSSCLQEVRFWDAFLKMRPKDRQAQKERLLCLAYAKMHGQTVTINYGRYVADVCAYLAIDATDAAFLWDRVGHWAQVDGDWEQAEVQYRKAYSLEPDRYGYCLGVALNFLDRFEEALPILLEQATAHHPDALSWFQVAVAQQHVGDIPSCKESYQRALELDPEYGLAMFELGGVYWNHGPKTEALRIWSDAIRRFPDHELAAKLRRDFPKLTGDAD
jgi:tetratricopeptide (TPR) repeat protein